MKNIQPDLYQKLSTHLGYKSSRRFLQRGSSIFSDVDFSGKSVLDVGCGRGAWSFWAKLQGAGEVWGLEPELDGATSGTRDKFNLIKKDLGLDDSINVHNLKLQDLFTDKKFDIIILYNVINHLDEDSVVHYAPGTSSHGNLVKLAQFLKSYLSPDGQIIFTDAGKVNYFSKLGITPPLARTIEWEKHLEPNDWMKVFSEAGFRDGKLNWASVYPLGRFSQFELFQRFVGPLFILKFRA